MPNPLKYGGLRDTVALKKGNWGIGTNDVPKGPTSATDFWNSITPPTGGYVICQNKASQGPSLRVAADDAELLVVIRQMYGQTFNDVPSALAWVAADNTALVKNIEIGPVVTSGQLAYLDPGFCASYPKTGSTWDDISGELKNANVGGATAPTFSSINGGVFSFDGMTQYSSIDSGSAILSRDAYTKVVWFKPSDFLSSNSLVSGGQTAQHDLWLDGSGYLNSGHNGTWNSVTSTTATTTTDWWCGAVTYSATTMKLYVNGVLEDTDTAVARFAAGTGDVQLGRYGTTNYYNGYIAVVQLYNRELTSTEILNNFNAIKTRFIA